MEISFALPRPLTEKEKEAHKERKSVTCQPSAIIRSSDGSL